MHAGDMDVSFLEDRLSGVVQRKAKEEIEAHVWLLGIYGTPLHTFST